MPKRGNGSGPKRTPVTQALPKDTGGQPTLEAPAAEVKKYSKKNIAQ